MDPETFSMLKLHALNGAQRASDGAQSYAENQRYAYLQGKDRISFAESTGVRMVTGPHLQSGAPAA